MMGPGSVLGTEEGDANGSNCKQKAKQHKWKIIGVSAVLLILIIVLSVTLSKKKDTPDPTPTPPSPGPFPLDMNPYVVDDSSF